jgi:uncharacterized protein (TIGR02266 family)
LHADAERGYFPSVTDSDRRTQTRVPVEMWVEEEADNAVYFQRSANLSSGGLYLENTVPHPVGTRVRLRFTLPGDQAVITTNAEIVKTEAHSTLGMHLKFLDLPADASERIERFISTTLGR